MSESSKAVFLSYASQDAEAAARICESLRAAGIEVWFDQSELRGGDAWDRQIRKQIHECALFLAVISAHTNERDEGYFRREWNLAVERTADMAGDKPFLLPVVVDSTFDATARVPDKFRHVQWTRLPGGETPAGFCERVKVLLGGAAAARLSSGESLPTHRAAPPEKRSRSVAVTVVVAVVAAGIAGVTWQWMTLQRAAIPAARPVLRTATSAVPEKSIAVLPFVDMSEKKDQEYFSDGLSEELIDNLAKVPDLRVPARTSSFYFKGKQASIVEIAKALGVAHVLEGSVRKAGNILRVTTQLIRADTGYHLWSETYDRKASDVFKVQDEIAGAVVKALKVSLHAGGLSFEAGTTNVEANDLYLQGKFYFDQMSETGTARSVEYLTRAVALDPSFAKAWALISRVRGFQFYQGLVVALEMESARREARQAADKAVALDPNLAEGHVALGRVYMLSDNNLPKATTEFNRALEINPRDSDAILQLGFVAGLEGRIDDKIRLSEQALALDPLNTNIMTVLGENILGSGNPTAAEKILRRLLAVSPTNIFVKGDLGNALALLGKPSEALDFLESAARNDEERRWARALLYPSIGRAAEGDALLAALEVKPGSLRPMDIADIHAFRGHRDQSFEWLERQYRVDPKELKDYFDLDPFVQLLKGDARYKALLKKMNLPEK